MSKALIRRQLAAIMGLDPGLDADVPSPLAGRTGLSKADFDDIASKLDASEAAAPALHKAWKDTLDATGGNREMALQLFDQNYLTDRPGNVLDPETVMGDLPAGDPGTLDDLPEMDGTPFDRLNEFDQKALVRDLGMTPEQLRNWTQKQIDDTLDVNYGLTPEAEPVGMGITRGDLEDVTPSDAGVQGTDMGVETVIPPMGPSNTPPVRLGGTLDDLDPIDAEYSGQQAALAAQRAAGEAAEAERLANLPEYGPPLPVGMTSPFYAPTPYPEGPMLSGLLSEPTSDLAPPLPPGIGLVTSKPTQLNAPPAGMTTYQPGFNPALAGNPPTVPPPITGPSSSPASLGMQHQLPGLVTGNAAAAAPTPSLMPPGVSMTAQSSASPAPSVSSSAGPVSLPGTPGGSTPTPAQPATPKTWKNLPKRMVTKPIEYAYNNPKKTIGVAATAIGVPILFNSMRGEADVSGPAASAEDREATRQELLNAQMNFAERFGSSNPEEMMRRFEEREKRERGE